jgi:DNA topoisomerase-1
VKAIDKLQRTGIRRLGTPRTGFRYVRADRKPVPGAEAERIRALKLPPAWTEVLVSPLPSAKLQAIGKDRAGRWQYRYHVDFTKRRSAAKYRRLLRFASALPRIRTHVERDVRRRGLAKERVLAAMVRIIEATAMRPGSEAYAVENGSFGLATVRPRHVRVHGEEVTFDYRGKSGLRHVCAVRDRRIARLVREVLAIPGRDVFKFVEGGEIQDVRRRHLNAYVRDAAGAPFTAKDFRTWAGTLLCASELARRMPEVVPGRTSLKKVANAAVKSVAERLGNTPAVARSSYISPAVIQEFARGRCVSCGLASDDVLGLELPRGGLHPAEVALVELLRTAPRSSAKQPAPRLLAGGVPGTRNGTGARNAGGVVAKPMKRAARGPERDAERAR